MELGIFLCDRATNCRVKIAALAARCDNIPMTDADCIPGILTPLTPTLWRLTAPNGGPMTGPGTNTYFFGDASGVIVVDPGPNDATHLERIVAQAPAPIRTVAVTHTHRDHSPGAMPLAERLGVPTAGMAPPATPENDHGFVPTQTLADGDSVPVSAALALRAVFTPGHASNHLCYLTPDEILLTGDHIMQGATVVILPPDGDMQAYLDSLEKLTRMPLHAIAPGHGTVIDEPMTEINRVITHRLARECKVAAALSVKQDATIDDLLPLAYDDVPSFLYPLARRSLEAHLIRLERHGAAVRLGGRWQDTGDGRLNAIVDASLR